MGLTAHLSMRVPWRDRPWDQFICDDPIGNSSCTLLANIGPNRDDSYEVANSSAAIDTLDHDRLPCLSERATFMSPIGYTVMKKHPYAWNRALKDKLHPTAVSVPAFAFEAVPFRWLNRASLTEDVGLACVPAYNPTAEDHVDEILGFDKAAWVMDGDNQRAVLDAFFEPVVPDRSLVFIYLKHSPLQEQRTDRLIVGAARVARLTLPPMWNQSGNPPFSSSMWETIVEHSLRPDMTDGILLPYQQLIPLLDDGVDIDGALAWAPEGRTVEFSYVTEHLSDDGAIEALTALQQAADGMKALGVDVPATALDWLTAETERLWQLRGPVPGIAAVLAYIGASQPFAAAGAVAEHVGQADPWPFLERVFGDPGSAPVTIKPHLPAPIGRIWRKLPQGHQQALRLLSSFDITAIQVRVLMEGRADIELHPEELLDNPYFAAVCTYGMPEHVPFSAVDRALFPPTHVTWTPPIPDPVQIEGSLDRRRIEALLVDVLERQGVVGDTVVSHGEAIDLANAVNLSQAPNLTSVIIRGLDLDHDSIESWSDWSPLTSIEVAGGFAYKLTRYEQTSDVIRDWINRQLNRLSLGRMSEPRKTLDDALDRNKNVTSSPDPISDELEERARTEKAAGLAALYQSPLSVLIGPAGTGKTTLLKALVEHPGVAAGGVLLLAPTGKAKVQLETKVGLPAKTLASYLTPSSRYEGETGRYRGCGTEKPRQNYGLVVIDEASMLTEEMLAATLDAFADVKRLVLVGDPRQLPPIGAGRPFVDLVKRLRPATFEDWVRVGTGYVELLVPRRQLPDGSHGIRHDLELAAWFGEESRGAGDDAIWAQLYASPNLPTLRYEPWGSRTVVQALTDVMHEELDFHGHSDPEWAFALTYGATLSGSYLNWEPGAGEAAEHWQILSPTRSRALGTVELNRHIKGVYRTSDTRFAQRTFQANIASPVGPELIVRGDKVMQTINRRLKAYPATASSIT